MWKSGHLASISCLIGSVTVVVVPLLLFSPPSVEFQVFSRRSNKFFFLKQKKELFEAEAHRLENVLDETSKNQ